VNDKMRPAVPDEADCRAFCDADPGCTGFSHQTSNGGFCFVYGAVDESAPAPWMVRVGVYPTVNSQCSPTTLYQTS
jgi:hypothetical protein